MACGDHHRDKKYDVSLLHHMYPLYVRVKHPTITIHRTTCFFLGVTSRVTVERKCCQVSLPRSGQTPLCWAGWQLARSCATGMEYKRSEEDKTPDPQVSDRHGLLQNSTDAHSDWELTSRNLSIVGTGFNMMKSRKVYNMQADRRKSPTKKRWSRKIQQVTSLRTCFVWQMSDSLLLTCLTFSLLVTL